jgi:hypothetical protein
MKYKKTFSDLEKVAIKWWPKDLEGKVAERSVIPKLLETQDKFISILKLSGKSPTQIFNVLEASDLPANLFLKHLVVLVDYGGELIKRLGTEFAAIFPFEQKTQSRNMEFVFAGKKCSYAFQALPVKALGNPKLKIDGGAIVKSVKLDALTKDMIMLLLFGSASSASDMAALERCDLGAFLGRPEELERYVKQKYLYVSRITTGASANSLGQIAQVYVADYLRTNLDDSYKVQSNGRIALRSYDKEGGMPFDVVIFRKTDQGKKMVGVEVSFQVTSNSVIERKASLAEDRLLQMSREGHYIAYVLDGAGNFSRSAALTTLCQNSDCTVAYSHDELDTLVDFIRGKLDDSIR